ncbi:MAG: ABC transporter permease [Selenomonadaceae bacterium]|nr:ABC transporter permease [Selenomonadaceae bacterium]
MFANIWQYRQFIYSCVKRDFQLRYTGSMLGALWAVFQPLAMILVYTLVFSEIMKSKLQGMEMMQFAYSIYLCSGVLTWGLFAETLNGCVNVFLANGNLMKKVSFPRICLPVIAMLSALSNFVVGFGLFLAFLLLVGQFPWTVGIFFFLVLAIQTLFSVTLGIGLGVLNVFFRDVGQMLGVALQFWFWFTPVVYPAVIVPESLRGFFVINPMYHIVSAYQSIFVYHRCPELEGLGAVLVLGLVIGVWALRIYRKHVGEMVDEL